MDFNEYLLENYAKPLDELSNTGHGNILINRDDIQMISLDDMSKELGHLNRKYKGNVFSTADALFITNNGENIIFYFIEFKNRDFKNKKDVEMSKYWLDKAISKMKSCEHGCFINNDESKFYDFLIDKDHVSFRAKPMESLSVVNCFLHDYLKNNSGSVDKFQSIERLFNIEKYYVVVSLTDFNYNIPFAVNKGNVRRKLISPFLWLVRLSPYHYTDVIMMNEIIFSHFLSSFE